MAKQNPQQAGDDTDTREVTPAMEAAGVAVIVAFDRRVAEDGDLAVWVYEAMERARLRSRSSCVATADEAAHATEPKDGRGG